MFAVLRSQEFDKWLAGLKDTKGKARILARLKSAELAIWAMWRRWAAVSVRCESIMVPATGSILPKRGRCWFSCFWAEIRILRSAT